MSGIMPVAPTAVGVVLGPVEALIVKRDLAGLLSVDERTIDVWMQQGLIPYYKVKNSVRFRYSMILAHWEAHYRVCTRWSPVPVNSGPGHTVKGRK